MKKPHSTNPLTDANKWDEYVNWCNLQPQGQTLPSYEEWLKRKLN